jgi:hypothetical protein
LILRQAQDDGKKGVKGFMMKKLIYFVALVALLVLAGGQDAGNYAFDQYEQLKTENLVGGGFEIDYTAPSDGTVFQVEKTSGKISRTKTLVKGEKFNNNFTSLDDKTAKTLFGLNVKEMNFELYFVPATPTK